MGITGWKVINFFLLTVCVKYSSAGSCRDGWLQYGENCYFVANQSANWSEAASNCTQMNSTLTSIIDEYEHEFIVNISNREMDYWIGLEMKTAKANCCQWIDGSRSLWSYWASDEPDSADTCATVAFYGKWRDKSCDQRMATYKNNDKTYTISYICKTVVDDSHDDFISTSDTTTTLNVEGDKLMSESDESSSSSLVIAVCVSVSLIVLVGLAVLIIVLWLKRRKKRTRRTTVEENVYTTTPNESSVPQMEMSPSNSERHPTTTVRNDDRHDNSQGQTDPNQSHSNQDVTELYAEVKKKPRTTIDFQMQDNPNYSSFGD